MVVNASPVGYKPIGGSIHPSDYVQQICTALAKRNIDVLLICETKRHHSKRATQQHIAMKEKARVKSIFMHI